MSGNDFDSGEAALLRSLQRVRIVEEDVLGGKMVTLNVVVGSRLVRNVMPSGCAEGSTVWRVCAEPEKEVKGLTKMTQL